MSSDNDNNGYQDQFMIAAIDEAKKALSESEVPVGCVFVDPVSNTIITRGHNLTNLRKNALEHAELVAIGKYSDQLMEESENTNENKIKNSHLYVSVEPCIMCAAALLYHGVGKVFFGCRNPRFGGNGTILGIHDDHCGDLWKTQKEENNVVGYESYAGYREDEAIKLLQNFYEQENPTAPAPRMKVRRKRNENETGQEQREEEEKKGDEEQ